VVRDELSPENQKHDLMITFTCPGEWNIEGSLTTTVYSEKDRDLMVVDPETCVPISTDF